MATDFLRLYDRMVDLRASKLRKRAPPNATVGETWTVVEEVTDKLFVQLLDKYKDLHKLGLRTKKSAFNTTHHIVTTRPPVYARARRFDPEKLRAAKDKIQLMTNKGVCKASCNWANPLHMVNEANGEWRPCGDYKVLNAQTVPERYPIPYFQDYAHTLYGKTFFWL